MPTPDKPSLDYSYTAFQEAQGSNNFPGTQLDNDLANLKTSIDETIDFVSGAVRDDGKLQNGIVTKNSLAEDVLLGVAAPRPWAAATVYAVDQTATINNSLYIATTDHTSGVFADDLAAGRWALLIEFTVPAAILDGSVTEPKHATGGVSTRALADNSVTAAKVPDGELTAAKLAAAVQAAFVPVGAEVDFSGVFAPAGWVFKAGQALSRVTYAALFGVLCPAVIGTVTNASGTISGLTVDLRNMGLEGSKVEGAGIPTGATVSSVTATTIVLSANATASTVGAQIRLFPNGNGDGATTFNLPDNRGRSSIGRDNMGGTAASRVTASGYGNPGVDATKLGAAGGVDRLALVAGQIPVLTGTTGNAGAHAHGYLDGGTSSAQRGALEPSYTMTSVPGDAVRTTDPVGDHAHSVTVNGDGGQAHPNLPPSRVSNKIIFTGVV